MPSVDPHAYTPEEFAQLDHGDRGAAILAAHWGLTALATVFLALRLYCKRITKKSLWWDDWILIASWLVILGTDIVTTILVVDFGLGKHSWDIVITNYTKFKIIIDSRATITLTSMGWTKTAFAVTLLRLTSGMTKRFVWFIIISLNVITLISAAIPWIQCAPVSKTWDPSVTGGCWAPMVGIKIWIAMGAYSGLMDFTLAALPWTFIYSMRLRKREKLGILIAMSMGACAGVAAIVKCVQLPKLGSPDTYVNAGLFILDITESVVTIVAACIPSLRVLIREVTPSSHTQSSHVTYSFDVSEGGKGSFKEVVAHEKLISNGPSSKQGSNC
ncbi:uncharacterized protein DNG_08042 [Cephalotrichum gorgonifer]|uniref:Rhodopsin domain-containing protein n=1 Tax=Cephalotrichum gorgonifer TaxID=2041049 RepID=A0AAE8SXZ5_9PEZI|nr:uncharacterized protein DNG_08042 [Cephalotrichum gorgonifer]